MTRRPDAEARAKRLSDLIDARSEATENDIRAGRAAIVRAVAERTGGQFAEHSLNCNVDEAEALVRAAVVGRSALVGARIAGVVQTAIFDYVAPLAEQDLVDAERRRADESASDRAMRWLWDRGVLA